MEPIRCGLIGHPVSHSRSAAIHRAFAAQAGLALDYELIDAARDQFEHESSSFFASGGHGLNVTLPHKVAACAFADEADEAVRKTGAANVLIRLPDGRVRASNTDGIGFIRDLIANVGFDVAGKRVLILGAGGAAAGIAPRLLGASVASLAVYNRTRDRAVALVERLADSRVVQYSETPAGEFLDLVVNATSASLLGEELLVPEFSLAPGALACDLSYENGLTPFLRQMQTLGARTADGWGMLVEQAAESFYLWHGIRPDTAPVLRR